MQYSVPQFIEIEDRVIGPLTIRQFLMILTAGILTAASYSVFDIELFVFTGVVLVGLAAAFAFIKINGQTLEKYLTHVLYYFANPKTRIWAKELSVPLERISNRGKRRIVLKSSVGKEEISRSKLHELSTLLDTSSRNYAVSNEPTESKSGSSAEPTPREGSVSTDSRS